MSTNIDETQTNQVGDQPPLGEPDDSEHDAITEARQSGDSMLQLAKNAIPTLLVMGLLAGVGYFGHHHGWKAPKFSELIGQQGESGVQWCEEHGVAEADCIACNADLMPKGELFGWCREHGVHECVLHHPETAQLGEIPLVTQADHDRASRAIALRPRTKNDPGCKMHLRRIQLPSIEAVDRAGIDINLVDRGRIVESVSASGEVLYDPTRVARLAARAAGTVWQVRNNVGDQVKRGDVLALVDAVEVGRTKAELLQAVARLRLHGETVKRLEGLENIVAGKRLLEAQAARAEAEAAVRKTVQALQNLGLPLSMEEVSQKGDADLSRHLRFLGLPQAIVNDLDASRTTANLVPIVAPRNGVVVIRDVVAGEVTSTDRMLFTIADTSVMWIVLNVPLEEVRRIATGQEIIFRPDGDDHTHSGRLTWISTDVDANTRTIKVRGNLSNEDGHLRNETFGSGEIVLRIEDDSIVVPSSAVHWEGCCHVVFVRNKDYFTSPFKVFHTRSVRPGVSLGDTTEVIAGLLPDEVIVAKGSGVLRAELLKGNLGAG